MILYTKVPTNGKCIIDFLNLDIIRINNGSLYPHMEIPEKINSIIEDFI